MVVAWSVAAVGENTWLIIWSVHDLKSWTIYRSLIASWFRTNIDNFRNIFMAQKLHHYTHFKILHILIPNILYFAVVWKILFAEKKWSKNKDREIIVLPFVTCYKRKRDISQRIENHNHKEQEGNKTKKNEFLLNFSKIRRQIKFLLGDVQTYKHLVFVKLCANVWRKNVCVYFTVKQKHLMKIT